MNIFRSSLEQVSSTFRLPHVVTAIAWSPDGRVLATADGSAVRIWDHRKATAGNELVAGPTVEAISRWRASNNRILDLHWHPGGHYLAVAKEGKAIYL